MATDTDDVSLKWRTMTYMATSCPDVCRFALAADNRKVERGEAASLPQADGCGQGSGSPCTMNED